ncbi:hypothetical protein BJ878DRAFT_540196 [Calycina marina]|uniref:Uncharacterized protein n=1 Tax=Calycina marina TaxID=1763456 RepID=A0A9P7Z765_9HELO|nr:hypothetical protein BJ878DRAFT_540196 [Calycina marina]
MYCYTRNLQRSSSGTTNSTSSTGLKETLTSMIPVLTAQSTTQTNSLTTQFPPPILPQPTFAAAYTVSIPSVNTKNLPTPPAISVSTPPASQGIISNSSSLSRSCLTGIIFDATVVIAAMIISFFFSRSINQRKNGQPLADEPLLPPAQSRIVCFSEYLGTSWRPTSEWNHAINLISFCCIINARKSSRTTIKQNSNDHRHKRDVLRGTVPYIITFAAAQISSKVGDLRGSEIPATKKTELASPILIPEQQAIRGRAREILMPGKPAASRPLPEL